MSKAASEVHPIIPGEAADSVAPLSDIMPTRMEQVKSIMEAEEYRWLRREVLNLTGVDLECYKGAQMQRRLTAYLRRSGHITWPAFFHAIRRDPDAVARLKDHLTINVSSFFRDADQFHYLATRILPQLARDCSLLRVWSAGCSRGQEPYSLAMLLDEMNGVRYCILATDLDRKSLEVAGAGGPYVQSDVATVPRPLLARHFTIRDGKYYVAESLRRRVNFRQMNLLAEPFEGNFDLIVCRNVLIYFTGGVKEVLYRRFYEALRPGGILFVGGTEVISKASDIGFEMVGISFYRRGHPITAEMRKVNG